MNWRWVAGIAVVAALFIGPCSYVVYQTDIKPGTVTFTVEGKERIAENEDGKWMVYATDGQTFQVTDNIFYWMFDSTDRYREVVVGETYTCDTIGVRWHFLSSYKNIRNCEVS